MSDFTTMTMAVHRAAVLESQHPVHAMAYDLGLEKRLARRGRWWQRLSRPSLVARQVTAAKREATLSPGC